MTDISREQALAHFGVKGMRWGVRNDTNSKSKLVGLGPDVVTRTMANGDTLTLQKRTPTKLHKSIAKVSERYVKSYNEGAYFVIKDKSGQSIGEANLWKKNSEELYLNWIEIKKSARGQGYATETLKAAADYGRKQGFKKMTLEVPGISPDARHIYERMGFKTVKESSTDDDIWGGLTSMEYDFKRKNN